MKARVELGGERDPRGDIFDNATEWDFAAEVGVFHTSLFPSHFPPHASPSHAYPGHCVVQRHRHAQHPLRPHRSDRRGGHCGRKGVRVVHGVNGVNCVNGWSMRGRVCHCCQGYMVGAGVNGMNMNIQRACEGGEWCRPALLQQLPDLPASTGHQCNLYCRPQRPRHQLDAPAKTTYRASRGCMRALPSPPPLLHPPPLPSCSLLPPLPRLRTSMRALRPSSKKGTGLKLVSEWSTQCTCTVKWESADGRRLPV